MDTIVERDTVEVLRVRADMDGAGPKAAFDRLEARLPTLRGRKFYGAVYLDGPREEYYACVERRATEDPLRLGLELATIPGGRYIRRKLHDWNRVIAAGRMKAVSEAFAQEYRLDPKRLSLEFYRSMTEMHMLHPLADDDGPPDGRPVSLGGSSGRTSPEVGRETSHGDDSGDHRSDDQIGRGRGKPEQ